MRSSAIVTMLTPIILAVLACRQDANIAGPQGEQGVDGPPVSRSETILMADRYAMVLWMMTEENRSGVTCGGTFQSTYPVGQRMGVGYKWGGWTYVDEFLTKIELGYATGTGGNVTYETIPFDCVVGVSCTGLVSRAWHLDNKYTLNYDDPDIPRKFQEITQEIEGVDIGAREVDGLRKGDVFINEYHVMLFVYETTSGVAMIFDSSYSGVRFRPVLWADLAGQNYKAIRYNNIFEDHDPPGTSSNPIDLRPAIGEISVSGNTRDVVSLEFHTYSVDPFNRQSGPENVYRISVNQKGLLRAAVTSGDLGPVRHDLHLLSSLRLDAQNMALDCVAGCSPEIEAVLEEGTWYLVVDSCNNTPGRYLLTSSIDYGVN